MSSATFGAMRKLIVQQWVTVDNIRRGGGRRAQPEGRRHAPNIKPLRRPPGNPSPPVGGSGFGGVSTRRYRCLRHAAARSLTTLTQVIAIRRTLRGQRYVTRDEAGRARPRIQNVADPRRGQHLDGGESDEGGGWGKPTYVERPGVPWRQGRSRDRCITQRFDPSPDRGQWAERSSSKLSLLGR